MEGNEIISAFAFRTGKAIEKLIIEETNNLKETNKMLEAKILDFWARNRKADDYNVGPLLMKDFEKTDGAIKSF